MLRWYILLFCFPLFAAGQELKPDNVYVQSNKKRLETFPVNVVKAADVKMDVVLRAEDTSFFLQLRGSGIGANTIVTNDSVIFLLDDDSTVTVKSAAIQGYNEADSTRTYQHEYLIQQKDLEMLSRHNVQALRKYSVVGFEDIYLSTRDAANLKPLFTSFLEKLSNENLLKPKAAPLPPSFPGGKEVLLSFLNKNLKVLPTLAAGERKKVLLQFQVTSDGTVNDVQVKQSAGIPYDTELLRIVKRMPKWKPALDDDKPISAIVTQEVNFYNENMQVKVQF